MRTLRVRRTSSGSMLNLCSEERARQGIESVQGASTYGAKRRCLRFVAEFIMDGTAGLERDQWEALKWVRKAIEGRPS